MVIEMRTYKLKPGTRARFLKSIPNRFLHANWA
jgi:hypothetical protein